MVTLYTMGHGNRRTAELLGLLHARDIHALVDVRAHPQSRHNPQFNENSLRRVCERAGLSYHRAGRQLGGRRAVSRGSPHSVLPRGLRGFADYMQTDGFVQAANRLLEVAGQAPTVIMCAEYDPCRCHRALIADYLTSQGHKVIHFTAQDEEIVHRLHDNARRQSAQLIYNRFASGRLDLD